MVSLTTHDAYPPFPSGLPTASLGSISLQALQSPSASSESAKVFEACRTSGFFYLDLTGSEVGESILRAGEELLALSQDFFALPHEVKDQYGQDKVDPFFSYRWTQCAKGVQDVWGRSGRREMYNLRADDILNIRPRLPRHAMISSAESILSSFALHCREVVRVLLTVMEQRLQLPPNALLDLHRDDVVRGDFISLQHRAYEPSDDATIRNGEHTDFGSITMLFNWLGGLQIREQSREVEDSAGKWLYIKPVPGSCVINLGDSLVKLSAGILRSNIHRVAPPPGPQANLPRYSLVYFSHPNDDVELKPVRGGLVSPALHGFTVDEIPITAAEWVTRRSLGDLRGVYTTKGLEWRDNNDAVTAAVQTKA